MIWLYYISLIFFCTYIIGNVIKHGIPESISETAYLNKKYGFHFFLLFTIFTSLPIMIWWLTITAGQTFQFLVFLSCIALMFVGIAGKYKNGMDRTVHMTAAYTSGVCSLIWSIIYTHIWPISILLLCVNLAIGWKTKGMRSEGEVDNSIIFFGELSAFTNLFLSTYVYYLMM